MAGIGVCVLLLVFCLGVSVNGGDVVYVSNGSHILSFIKGNNDTTALLGERGRIIVGLAVDLDNHLMFWSDISEKFKGIYRADLGGDNVSEIVQGAEIGEVNSIAVDWVTNHLYFSDTKEKTIEVTNYDGSARTVLISERLHKPMSIAVSPLLGFLFWVDAGSKKIEQAWLNGANRKVVVKSRRDNSPNQLSISHEFRQLYWVDSKAHAIFSYDLHSKEVKKQQDLKKVTSGVPGYGLVVIGNTAVISTWFSTSIVSLLIETKLSVWKEEIKNLGTRELYSLVSLDPTVQHMTYHPCSNEDNGGCSHLCLPAKHLRYTCVCPAYSGLVLAADEKTCQAPNDLLVMAFRDTGIVGFISLDESHGQAISIVGHSDSPLAVTYDPVKQLVYWGDSRPAVIYQSRLDEREKHIVVELPGTLYDLAYNHYTGNMYYISSVYVVESKDGGHNVFTRNTVEMINVETKERKTILNLDYTPRGLALDLEKGFLYVTVAGADPQVIQTDLEGREESIILSEGTMFGSVGLHRPCGVFVGGDTLYVIDQDRDTQFPNIHRYNTVAGTWSEPWITVNKDQNPDLSTSAMKYSLEDPISVAARDGTVYFTGEYPRDGKAAWVMAISPGVNSSVDFLVKTKSPVGLFYTPAFIGPDDGNHSCGGKGCGYFCPKHSIIDNETKECICPDKSPYMQKEAEDSDKCQRPTNFLVYADMTTIQMVSLDPWSDERPTVLHYGDAKSNFVALTYDSESDRLFWSDHSSDTIYMSGLASFKPTVLFKETGQVDSMAINKDRGILYWTTVSYKSRSGYIAKINLKRNMDSYGKILTDLNNPGTLALDPTNKYLYWTQRRHGKGGYEIHTAKVTGRRHRVLISLSEELVPRTIVIHDDRMYISDESGNILVTDLEGPAIQPMVLDNISHMYGLTVFKHILFFTDWLSHSLNMVDIATQKVIPIATNLMRPTSVAIYHEDYLQDNACFAGYLSPCSDGCIPLIKDMYHCTCPDGKHLDDDNETCINTDQNQPETQSSSEPTTTARIDIINTTLSPVAIPTQTVEISTTTVTVSPPVVMVTTTEVIYGHESDVFEDRAETTPATTSEKPNVFKEEKKLKMVPDEYPVLESTTKGLPYIENCPGGDRIILTVPSNESVAVLPIHLVAYDSTGEELELESNHMFDDRGIVIPWEGIREESHHIMVFKSKNQLDQIALCEFIVVLQDVDPPIFSLCPNEMTLRTEQVSTPAFWSVPIATDNVGVKEIFASHLPGTQLPPGHNIINYTATDFAGNQADCAFMVVVIQDQLCKLPTIDNGGIVCNHGDGEDGDCSIVCEDGYLVNPIRVFRKPFNCKHPDDIAAMIRAMKTQKSCLLQQQPSLAIQEFRLLLTGPIEEHRQDVMSHLSDAITRHLGEQKSCVSDFCTLGNLAVPNVTDDLAYLEADEVDRNNFYVMFNITLFNKSTVENAEMNVEMTLKKIQLDLTSLAAVLHIKMGEHHFRAVSDRIITSKTMWKCPPGQITERDVCISCPAGTYHNRSLNVCQYCNHGYYQVREGQIDCNRCQAGEISDEGSTRKTDCKTVPSMDEMTLFLIVTACTFGVVFLCMAITLYLQFQRQQKRNQQAASQKKPRYMTPNIYVAPPPILKSKLLDENTFIAPRSYSIDKKHPFNIYANHDYEDVDGRTNSTTTNSATTTPMTVYQNDVFAMSPGFGMKSQNTDLSPDDDHSTMSRENTFSKYSPKFAVRKNYGSNGVPSPNQPRKLSRDSTFSNHSPKMSRAQRTPSSDGPLITQSPLLRLKLAAYNFNQDDQ